MEIVSYNWGDEQSNQVGICIESGGNTMMVWCDEDGYEIDGAGSRRYQHFGGGGFGKRATTASTEIAHALGEALYQMIGGYR